MQRRRLLTSGTTNKLVEVKVLTSELPNGSILVMATSKSINNHGSQDGLDWLAGITIRLRDHGAVRWETRLSRVGVWKCHFSF